MTLLFNILNETVDAVRARLKGPGGIYNLGNAITLSAGLALHSPAQGSVSGSAFDTAFDYLAGSGGAIALTVASLIFFWSGEVYHRAFSTGDQPDIDGKRFGDFLSGVGAIALGIGLMLLGDTIMAFFAGLLHATGKFGSAFQTHGGSAWRITVLASRVPAIFAALVGISIGLPLAISGVDFAAAAAPLAVLVSCLLWAKADLLLMIPASSNEAFIHHASPA